MQIDRASLQSVWIELIIYPNTYSDKQFESLFKELTVHILQPSLLFLVEQYQVPHEVGQKT